MAGEILRHMILRLAIDEENTWKRQHKSDSDHIINVHFVDFGENGIRK